MRAVLDANVIVSAVLSRSGAPAKVLRAWLEGAYELAVSPSLLRELERVLDYPKIADRITRREAEELLGLLRRQAESMDDPEGPPVITSPDPDDDYLISLAEAARAVIVSGDAHLQSVAEQIPVFTPAAFLALLTDEDK
ncbi:MAG: putative toxin-antitoxin system toxin component, PIN family [Acidimicrobiales bacterium]